MIERTAIGGATGAEQEVGLGSTVCCRDADGEHRYMLVVPAEADPLAGRISVAAPVGRALLGRTGGEEVDVATPGGVRVLTILTVED
ncbi:MAG TPA: GreA/GreB family elongation factor [Candidatus Dormibacteraeota bacterium]|jgi:transcription elongation factor GreA|nr:GreA/GreB family elongation factor [Candidatus Dormibacteraeota bacterium]